jgi:hypothetical protein
MHLRDNRAPGSTPLHTVYETGRPLRHVRAKDLTNHLRLSCKAVGNELGLCWRDISARALRAGGAMALVRARIDSSLIRMMGRWKSWAMLEYLHRSATDTTSYAELMLDGGRYAISRHCILPDDMPQASPSEPLSTEL